MDLYDKLNERQSTAVTSTEGPLLVLAGAGTGKTRVVTHRILHLLEIGVASSQIVAVTFTNKAAREMRERVQTASKRHVLICTFHSLGLRILRAHIGLLAPYTSNFIVYDEEDARDLLKACLKEMQLDFESPEELKGQIKAAREYISEIKSNPAAKLARARDSSNSHPIFDELFQRYQAKLASYNGVDFDDLIYLPVKILQNFPAVKHMYQQQWSYFLCDEYQDCNPVQSLLLRLLSDQKNNLCVVGDPDQSIYAWRGADISNIMDFQKEYPAATLIALEQNYRSRTNILEAANALIAHNALRYKKELWSERGKGEKIALYFASSEKAEAEFIAKALKHHHQEGHIPWNQMAVFYRTHAQSRAFEDLFYLMQIPYAIVGGTSFYQRREIKDILSLLRMLQGDGDFLAFKRSVNLPKRGFGEASIDKLVRAAESRATPIFPFCQQVVEASAGKEPLRLSGQQSLALKEYVQMIQALRAMLQVEPLHHIVQETIDRCGYVEHLKKDPLTFQQRLENLGALIAKAAEWEQISRAPSLEAFLEELTLKSQADEAGDKNPTVHLMTLHNGKGLEYDIVFLAGLENGIFPHVNSMQTPQQFEEERRLCYVGMTRARERLYLSAAKRRVFWGMPKMQDPSPFLSEIPSEYLEDVSNFQDVAQMPYPSTKFPSSSKAKASYANRSTEADPELKSFEVGDLVSHAKFGEGVIQHIYTGSAGLTFIVRFLDDQSERSLVARHAHLQKME